MSKWLVYSVSGGYWYRHTGTVPGGHVDAYCGDVAEAHAVAEREGVEVTSDDAAWLAEADKGTTERGSTMKHRHRPHTTKTVGFAYCVAPYDCTPAAHGGVTHIETCKCGATRRINSTGSHREEVGAWARGMTRAAAEAEADM